MEQDYNLKKWSKGCPNTGINCRRSSCGIEYVFIPAALGDDQEGSPVAPKNGSYNNAVVYYEATGNVYLYSSDGVPTRVEKNLDSIIAELQKELNDVEEALSEEATVRETADAALGGRIDTVADNLAAETANRIGADEDLQNNITAEATARENGDAALNTAIASEATARQEADTNLQNQITQETQARAAADTAINEAITAEASTRQTADAGLQNQIDAITASSDVTDIVGTYAQLQAYDTSTLGNNDIIKVLQDESRNGETTYYRWNTITQQFTLIGEEGPYYTKSQADTLLNAKQNTLTAGSNVQIVNDTISATDTTYTAGTGLALNGTQFSVDTTTVATQSDLAAGLAGKQDTLTAGANITIDANNVISATGGGSGGVSDVQIAGTSIVNGGVANIDYASASKVGVIRTNTDYGTSVTSVGALISATKTYQQYQDTTTPNMFISKGTLENVITGKGLVDQTALAGKQDKLTAGSNITISGNTISATNTTYTAGDNITISNGTISATDTTYTAGTGISINNNVISASGGETMLVTISQTTIGQHSDIWVWSSDYTFAQLTANPDAIRVFVDDWCYESEGNIKPTDAKVGTFEQSTEIYLVRDLAGVEMRFALQQPQELEGQTVNPAIFDVTNFVDKNKTLLTILPTLTLADNATSIPDGTTITLQTLSSDKEMYSVNGNSDCYPHERIINGNFMILPVKRKVGSGASYWAEEECLVTSVSTRGTSNVADRYIYKTFAFNGEHYKMTLTSDSYPNVVYTITKIPGGQTYTAGTGIDITNGVISCTFANGNGVSY